MIPPRRAVLDRDRDGFVLGEGAGWVVLEEFEHAKRRGATVYAELAGYGMSGDAYHMTAPQESGEAAARCMENALRNAGAQSRGHRLCQTLTEPRRRWAISPRQWRSSRCFGDHAKKLAVSSTKS